MSSAASKSLGWVSWSSLGLGLTGFSEFALVAVLARRVSQEEFGVLTAALILIGLGKAIHAGVGPALVQREELRPEHIRTGFSLCLLTGLGLVAVLWAAAPAVAHFFNMPALVDVLRAMSLMFLLQAPGLVAESLLQREMQMRALAMSEVAGVVLGYLPLGIVLALLDFGIWALVAAHLGQTLFKYVVLMMRRPHEWALLPVRGATGDLLRFSGGFVAARLCNVAASESDKFVVGRWMSDAHLGVYGRAYRLMVMPAMFLGEVVDRVSFPLMSRLQGNRQSLCEAYGRGVSLVSTILAPASAAGIVLAPEFVRVMLGSGWDNVVAPFQVLMAGLVFRTGYKISDLLARATGTVYARAWRQAIFAALIFVGALVGTKWGVTGVAAGIVAALGANYFIMAWLSIETTGLGWLRFLALHLRGIVFGALFGVVVALVAQVMRGLFTSSLVVFSLTLTISLAMLGLAVVVSPARVLGSDGLWLVATLRGRAGTS